MKLVNHELGIYLDLIENKVNVLVLEEPLFFRKVVESLMNQISGEDGEWVLSDNDKIKALSKFSHYIADPINLELNSSKIQTKLYQVLKEAAGETLIEETATINGQITKYLDQVVQNSQFIIDYNLELDFQGLLKLYHVGIIREGNGFVENFISYLKVHEQLMQKHLVFISNFKLWVTDEELVEIYQFAFSNKIDIVLLENLSDRKNVFEFTTVVDKDRCVISY